MAAKIKYAPTFEQLVSLCIEHLSPFSSEKLVIKRILRVIDRFERQIGDNPEAAHVSPHLSSLGMVRYREFTADGFRILFRYEEKSNTVFVVLFCSQKQDLSDLLVNYCLIYK